MKLVTVVGFLLASSLSMASGWDCRGEGYTAKIRNSTTSTRTPALFLVTYKGNTEMRALEGEINKRNLNTGVRYVASNEADVQYILFVDHKEGANANLNDGDEVEGKLVQRYDGTTQKFDLTCKRYLKNN